MVIRFRVKNFDLTAGAREKISNKLNKLSDMFHPDSILDVYILKRDNDYKCEIKTQRGKEFIRSEEKGKTIEYSVDNAINTLKKRVRKVKAIKITKKRYGGSVNSLKDIHIEDEVLNMAELEMDLENSIDFKVERRKFLNPESISEDEAAFQLELLNHSFYIFRNKDLQDKICVLYRREIGYGLITID